MSVSDNCTDHCFHRFKYNANSTDNIRVDKMKIKTLLVALSLTAGSAFAQTADPIIMTIGGKNITRSEFEYAYNKNAAESTIDRKSIEEYVDLFVNYKLKVIAAEQAGIDTTAAFRKEFLMYRDQQVRPTFIVDDDIEREARNIYKQTQTRIDAEGGMVHPQHILVALSQQADAKQQRAASLKADSIYKVLIGGADFADMARQMSDDKGSGMRGGDLSWIQRGQTIKEFEQQAFALNKGEISKPFLSPYGYHIVRVVDKRNFFPYDSVRADIRRFIESRGLRERIISARIDSIAKLSKPTLTPQQVIDRRAAELMNGSTEMGGLIREYHDGLLLYEISNRIVWERAANDTQAQQAFFKKNRKKYAWTEPRFKGAAFYTRNQADAEAVRKLLRSTPFDKWAEALKTQFNDSTERIKATIGIFAKGDNATVDRAEYGIDKTDASTSSNDIYNVEGTYGKMIKRPQAYTDVRELVVSDLQEQLEHKWVAELRRKYAVHVNREVLATVNKH